MTSEQTRNAQIAMLSQAEFIRRSCTTPSGQPKRMSVARYRLMMEYARANAFREFVYSDGRRHLSLERHG